MLRRPIETSPRSGLNLAAISTEIQSLTCQKRTLSNAFSSGAGSLVYVALTFLGAG